MVKDDGAREVTGGWHAKHQRWHVEGAFDFRRGRNVVRLERRSGPVPHIDKLLLVPVEPGAGRAGSSAGGAKSAATPVALRREILERWVAYLREGKRGAEAVTKALREADGENRALLVREYAGRFAEVEAALERVRDRRAGKTGSLSDPELERLRAILHDEKGPYRLSGDLGRFIGEEARRELERLGEEKKELEKSRPVLPRAMGVRDGKVEDLRVHIRGNYQTLGDEVPRRFPRIFGEDPKPIARESSGRLELARWMTRREHPLTARVMANRIWLWHFGEGIVRSPDNFGTLGEPPSHPQLLDWLALRFVESGWSLKAMHRLVLLSSTYRMSTTFNEKAAGVDPKNLIWWRFPRRRLEAEEIRDSVLALGRALDLRMYGQLLPDKNRDYVTGTGSKEGTYDFPRRSVYLPVLRSAVYQVFQTFDFADPSVLSGRRATTTVAPQALFLMNGSLVLRETRRAAERLLARPDTVDRERVRLAYELALSRPATAAELEGALEFVSRYEATVDVGEAAEGERRIRAWQGLFRVLVASNEFVYLD